MALLPVIGSEVFQKRLVSAEMVLRRFFGIDVQSFSAVAA
jgi:hypothetical protein